MASHSMYDNDELGSQHDLAYRLFNTYETSGNFEALTKAIEIGEKLAKDTPEWSPDKAARLMNLAIYIGSRHERYRSIKDLNRAVELTEEAINNTYDGHDIQNQLLSQLGRWLARRAEDFGTPDLDRAIEVSEVALALTPPKDRWAAIIQNNLANMLGQRFRNNGEKVLADLDQAVAHTESAVANTSDVDPLKAHMMHSLGSRLGERYKRCGKIEDLERAIMMTERSVKASPPDHPFRGNKESSLAKWISLRSDRLGTKEDMDTSIEVAHRALDRFPEDHPDRRGAMDSLGNKYGNRYEKLGNLTDLNKAIDLCGKAAAMCDDREVRANSLSNQGLWLGHRFGKTGSIADLNRAIDLTNEALSATLRGSADYALRQNNLGRWLAKRFDRIGSTDDIEKAVEATKSAVEATPMGQIDRPARLSDLGNWYGLKFQRLGGKENLNDAVKYLEMAIAESPEAHPFRNWWLNNLSIWVKERHKFSGDDGDLDRAISIAQEALERTPSEHPMHAGLLNNLGSRLYEKFEATKEESWLTASIEISKEAVEETDPGNADMGGLCLRLGYAYEERFDTSTDEDCEDLDLALKAYEISFGTINAPPMIRIDAARRAARIHAFKSRWSDAAVLFEQAVELLPVLSARALSHSDKQHLLERVGGIATTGVAMALNAGRDPYDALKLLELGRGIIAGVLLETRTDISALEAKHADLASAFIAAQKFLESKSSAGAGLSPDTAAHVRQSKQRMDAEDKLRVVIKRIREKPGFKNFLGVPSEAEYLSAAKSGPIVVVNVSSYRCDAFLIRETGIQVVALKSLKLREVRSYARALQRDTSVMPPKFLEWLWSSIGKPIMDALGFDGPPADGDDYPRLWWIPTGPLSHLPLHAAGIHAKGSTDTVMDRVMSSYASSVKALIHGRSSKIRQFTPKDARYALLVGMEKTKGASDLRFAGKEVNLVQSLCRPLGLTPLNPPKKKRTDLLNMMQKCNVFHFAGHGQLHPWEPSRSGLLLDGGDEDPLTVADLRDRKLNDSAPFLGYLSACSTGANNAEHLVDEGIHLISAFQLAGFRHVVGTLWPVSDKHCLDAAHVLYDTMIKDGGKDGMTDLSVCRGLHRALRVLRDGDIADADKYYVPLPTRSQGEDGERDVKKVKNKTARTGNWASPYWIPYVHFGP